MLSCPDIQKQKTLSFHDLRHPLIDPYHVVGNDFEMQESLCVITGSNMSGKNNIYANYCFKFNFSICRGICFC